MEPHHMRIPEIAVSVGHEVAMIHTSVPSFHNRKRRSAFETVLLSRSCGDVMSKGAFPGCSLFAALSSTPGETASRIAKRLCRYSKRYKRIALEIGGEPIKR